MSHADAQVLRARAATASPAVSASIVAEPPPAAPRVAPPIAPSIAPVAPAPDFSGLARQVASAEHVVEQATTAMRDAQDKLNAIGARVAALESERAAVIDRRAAGDRRDDDAATVSLLDADLSSLAALRSDQAGILALKQSEVNSATRDLGFARQRLAAAEDQHTYIALAAHARTLSDLMAETVNRLLAIDMRLNLSPSACWAPSPELISTLRKAAFTARSAW